MEHQLPFSDLTGFLVKSDGVESMSFLGIHPLEGLKECVYLCSDSGGWGPVLSDGVTLTKCFTYLVILNMANVVALFGTTAQMWALRDKVPVDLGPSLKLRFQVFLQIVQIGLLAWLAAANWVIVEDFDISVVVPIISCLVAVFVVLLTVNERHYYNVPSASLLFYWLFRFGESTYSMVKFQQPQFVGISIVALISLAVELKPRKKSVYQEYIEENMLDNPYDQANIFSKLAFTWMTPLMRKGYETYLTAADLPYLAAEDRTVNCSSKFEETWAIETEKQRPSLLWAILKAFGSRYMVGGFFKLIQDVMAFVQPQLLRLLIAFVGEYQRSDGDLPLTRGYYIAGMMFLVSLLQTASLHQYFERSFGTGMKVRSALTNAIFRKSLVLSGEERGTKTTGDTVNLMSIDTQRLQAMFPYGHILWSGPFQIILCLASLYELMGNAMWAGVIVMVIMLPLNARLAQVQKGLQKRQMETKDKRTRATSELLASIKSIKFYAWEFAFGQRLDHVRDAELANLRKVGIFKSATMFMWNFAPFMVSCVTFAFYVWLNDAPLTTEMVFPAIALFNLLNFPLAMFPMLISSVIEANVASERITNFFMAEELQKNAVLRLPKCDRPGDVAVSLENCTYLWSKDKPALSDISLQAAKGELTCIVGRVGTGKSSLLQAIMGNLHKDSGNAVVHGSIAYVAQTPWIFNGSVRENILFGCRYDESIYNETVRACALSDDLGVLPDGDSTIVGEKGISLSGGQKARISLARAVYARADVYLLDDPLSAVDEHVGRHIIENILCSKGLLATKAVILATNSIPVLRHAQAIHMVSDGKIVQQGVYKDVVSMGPISKLLKEFGSKVSDEVESASSSASVSSRKSPDSSEDSEEPPVALTSEPKNDNHLRRRASMRRPSAASFKPEPPLEVRKEHMEQGKVDWGVYVEYAKVGGYVTTLLFIFNVLLTNGTGVMANVWLKHWSEVNSGSEHNPNVRFYLLVYLGLGIVQACGNVSQNLLLWLGLALKAAKTLHNRMLRAILRAPMSFFETTPLGRIVNRFSNDVYKVDQELATSFSSLFNQLSRVMYTFLVISYGTPGFIFFVIPLALVYLYYQRYYLWTSRELKRLDSVSKSPIFAQFQETLDGIATVRAFNQEDRFNFINEHYLDVNNQAYFPSVSANRWLAVRLEVIGAIIILAAATLSVSSLPSGRISAGFIGLALSYALNITQSLNWIVRMTVEVETNIVSVERMLEYTNLPSEAPVHIAETQPAESWPSEGAVQFKEYSCRYRPELPVILKNINLDIKPREKIGIVGRTGAGKSSLTLALFRIIEATTGNIDIDRVDTSKLGLWDLRSHLSIIPQDSQLFEGSIRDNLDPNHDHSDEELWNVLGLSHLKEFVQTRGGGLDATVTESGNNLSNGQRQLVCLARAMLTKSKILVLDEATAAVDVETDQIVQQTIRSEFKDRTILTIAHRLNTIMDSDRIIVLSFGEVAEFGTPTELLANKDSLFYSLSKQGGFIG
ncbi:Metal resistance protein YCF1 [Wickerhamiella sorbophila]|uniref:Metal resistance protein YCF1 n=1 Tax=Wickerhamiella sorbophila TaxID=45607 RepID=A0A2T0FBT7_9ASCO|nr:Metal resistance protein YCF1 [Wickerhamiella sorbophila]PRT52473.1 Metal resistance protein YCF1 [Wickerhamiella sorbophila]